MREPHILSERNGVAGILTLNRPGSLNALDLDMLRRLRLALEAWSEDPAVRCVVLRGNGDRAFCAGGDVKAAWAARGNSALIEELFRLQYGLDLLIHAYPKPIVALIHGITMGGGCGLSLHAQHTVAAEDLVLAMPEAAIGLFPDVGASRFLAACPGHIGAYLGLTGARLCAADARWLGLVDHIVPKAHHAELIACLGAGADIKKAITKLAVTPRAEAPIVALAAEVNAAFGLGSLREIIGGLRQQGGKFGAETLGLLGRNCPFSLEVTHRSILKGRRPLADVLQDDLRIMLRLMGRNDYFEGVRAVLIDRDHSPKWSPGRLEEVDAALVDACFAPL